MKIPVRVAGVARLMMLQWWKWNRRWTQMWKRYKELRSRFRSKPNCLLLSAPPEAVIGRTPGCAALPCSCGGLCHFILL